MPVAVVPREGLLEELFFEQKAQIDHFFAHIDLGVVEQFLERILKCHGLLVFSGVGKSGVIAEKLALTMVSTGTRAVYLPPTNALHGDLGIVSEGDLFIFISKSGESDELLKLIPFVRAKGATPISWVSMKGSRLERLSDLTIHLPVERELCPFNLAPTTSAAVQLLFGDIVAVALMRSKNFSLSDYAKNHPAGRIGKRITMRVCDLMRKDDELPLARPNDLLVDSLVELSNKRSGCLLVVDNEGQLMGIFTDGDLRRALQKLGGAALHLPLKSLMTASCRSIAPDLLAHEAMQQMEFGVSPVMVLPVVGKDTRLLGLIRMHDIIQAGL